MLRPSDNLLDSSRAARRANLRAARLKAFGQLYRALKGLILGVLRIAWSLLLLWCLPFLYLTAAYMVLDLPARWLAHRDAWGGLGALVFAASVAVCLTGVSRAMHNAPPVAPVRPRFAKLMLGLSWVAAVLLTIGDLASPR